MKKQEVLRELNERNHRQNTCELKTLATQPVFGAGSPEASIVFIGEAPGKTEDTLGIPFMGAAGKFLDEMLNDIKLSRADVYITIVFLGRHAMRSFFPDLKIGEAHGKLIHNRVEGLRTEYFLPLYHPASALYNGALRETLKKDFAGIVKFLKRIELDTVQD